ncbi:hypothetical protein COO60DRAFT_1668498 [Scenedesmus sp. NREL 46B-D3]|nr:hypothetical protein COO60DRAFT_1668498 [Scenedesmus sp. NREL 46B-D3]
MLTPNFFIMKRRKISQPAANICPKGYGAAGAAAPQLFSCPRAGSRHGQHHHGAREPNSGRISRMFKDDGGPLQLSRNVTVTGAQGLDTVLDLAFLQSKVQLCPALVHSLALARAGPGGLVDPRVGRPSGSSIVRLRSAQRLRLACASAAPNMQAVMLKARSKPCVDATHHDSLGWAV